MEGTLALAVTGDRSTLSEGTLELQDTCHNNTSKGLFKCENYSKDGTWVRVAMVLSPSLSASKHARYSTLCLNRIIMSVHCNTYSHYSQSIAVPSCHPCPGFDTPIRIKNMQYQRTSIRRGMHRANTSSKADTYGSPITEPSRGSEARITPALKLIMNTRSTQPMNNKVAVVNILLPISTTRCETHEDLTTPRRTHSTVLP